MGFTGYAMLFVEEEDPERASRLYLRARRYGLKAIGMENPDHQVILARLSSMDKDQIEPCSGLQCPGTGGSISTSTSLLP